MENLSQAFKALGHPHRLALVRRLIERSMTRESSTGSDRQLGTACCGFSELADEIGVGKPTVSHHLKVLRQADLIEREQDGRRVRCRVNAERLEELRSFLDGAVPVPEPA